jgi:hypothetical protein
MACPDCNNKKVDCGCNGEPLSINQVCNPVQCDTQECSESFDAQCIIYTGSDILCDNTILITAGDNIAQAVANVIAFFCTQDGVDADIVCDTDTVVEAGTSINDALDLIVTYFCEKLFINTTYDVIATPDPTESLCTDYEHTITYLDQLGGTISTTVFNTRTCEPLDVCNATYLDSDPTSGDLFPICRNGDLGTIDYNDLLSGLNNDLNQMQWNLVNLTPHVVVDAQDQGLIVNQNNIIFQIDASVSLGRIVLIVGTNIGTTHTVTHSNPSVFIQYGATTTTAGASGSLTIDGEDTVELTYVGSNRWMVTRFVNPSGNPLVFV